MEEVWVVMAFESDGTTAMWLYDNEEMAENYKEELLKGKFNKDEYYLEVSVAKHKVLKKQWGVIWWANI